MKLFDRIQTVFTNAKTPPAAFRDAELGSLTSEAGLWRGVAKRDDLYIPFTVAGTAAAPDGGLLGHVRDLTRRFHEVESEGLAFLRAEVPEVSARKFTFHGLEFLREDEPGAFTLEWLAHGDDTYFWRVSYEAGKPKVAGSDD